MSPTRSSSTGLRGSDKPNKRKTSTTQSKLADESKDCPNANTLNLGRQHFAMLASSTLGDWMPHYEDLRPAERPGYALGKVTQWYQHMSKPTGNHVPDSFFLDLCLIKSILAAHLKDGGSAFKACVDSATLLAYQHSLTAFTSDWEAAAKGAIDCRFKQLRQAMRAGDINLTYEHTFHEAAWALDCLTAHNLREVDASAWQENVPIFLGPEESKQSLRQLRQHYQEYQYKVYSKREDTTLWLLVWRTLKLAYAVSRSLDYHFPGTSESTGFVAEEDFFSEPGIRERFSNALPEMSGHAMELVELLVAEYCTNVHKAYKTDDQSCRYYNEVSESPLSSSEVEEFDRRLSEKRVSPRLLYLAHRAAVRLLAMKGQEDLRWNRMAIKGTAWPILCESRQALDDKPLNREAVDRNHTLKAKLFAKPAGHSRISAFDYVHYPFPETRAHEVAASEQITRELGTPGILSDGARVQHVVNRPPRHVLPPSKVSSWATWRLRGPIGFLCYVLSARWRSRKVKPRPEAKPRAALTQRPDLKRRRNSPLSPTKDANTRIEKTTTPITVPKLRGGGNKVSSNRPRSSRSPSRPSYSPITDDGDTEQDVPANAAPMQHLTTTEKDRRLREFKEMTGTDSKPAYHNERFINDFLEPNEWDVELAMEAYIESVKNRRTSRNIENALRPNAASPAPQQRSPPPAAFYDPDPDPSLAPPRRPSTRSRSPAVRNTAPRPGTFDDVHDDSSSSDSQDNSDDSEPAFAYGTDGVSRVGPDRAVEYEEDGDDDSTEENGEEEDEGQGEALDGNNDSSWNISSRFIDPSLVQGGSSDNINVDAGDGAYNGGEAQFHDQDDDEDFDLYGDGQEDEELMEDDGQARNAGGNEGLDKENVPVPSIRDRFGPHPLFDVFEDDAPVDVRRGNAPSTRGNDSLFPNASGAYHPDGDQPLQSVEEGAEPELPPQPARPVPPRGLGRWSIPAYNPEILGNSFLDVNEPDEDDEDDEDYEPLAEDGTPPNQSPQAYADWLRNGDNDGDVTQSENEENHPPAPIVPRQPLGVLAERDPSLPQSGRLSPHAPGREMPCHPCPVYVGEYHHNCRCQYGLQPPPPYVHSRSPAPGPAQPPQQPPAPGQPGHGASPRYSPPDDGRDMSHPIIVRPVPLPDPFIDDADNEPQPLDNNRRSRSREDSRARRRRIRAGKRATEGPGRASPGASSRRRNPTPEIRRTRRIRSSPLLGPDDVKQRDSSPIYPTIENGTPGPSRVKKRSSSERSAVRAHSTHTNAPRPVISMQTYLDTMFRDEMMAELRRRQIEYRPTATAAALAARLHQADIENNLGLGNVMAYRKIMNQPDARKRPKGWKMPASPRGQ